MFDRAECYVRARDGEQPTRLNSSPITGYDYAYDFRLITFHCSRTPSGPLRVLRYLAAGKPEQINPLRTGARFGYDIVIIYYNGTEPVGSFAGFLEVTGIDEQPRMQPESAVTWVTEGSVVTFQVRASHVAETARAVRLGVEYTGAYFPANRPTTITLHYAAGETLKSWSIDTLGDGLDELDGAVTLTPLAGTGYQLGTGVRVQVLDDDTPSLTIRPVQATITEGTPMRFRITAHTPPARQLEFRVIFLSTPRQFTSGLAYTGVSLATGQTVTTVTVPTTGDLLDEPDGVAILGLFGQTGGGDTAFRIGTPSQASITIQDDDGPTLTLTADQAAVMEGELAYFTIRAARPPPVATSVLVLAREPDTRQLITLPAGASTHRLSIQTADNRIDMVDEVLTLVLLLNETHYQPATRGYQLGNPRFATVTIQDNDAAPSLSVAAASASEDAATLDFVVSLSTESYKTVTVAYRTSHDPAAPTAAVAGQDYRVTGQVLTFLPGRRQATFSVAIIDDLLDEYATETFTLTLVNLTNASPGEITATGSIRDNDVPVITVAAGSGEEGQIVPFRLSLSLPSVHSVVVSYHTSDGSAGVNALHYTRAQAGLDYHAATGTVSFGPGQTVATAAVQTITDNLVEADEVFTLTLSDPRRALLGPATAVGYIRQVGNLRVSIAAAGSTVITEGEDMAVRLTASETVTGDMLIAVSLTGTAGYYTGDNPRSGSIKAHQDNEVLVFRTDGDEEDEPDGTIVVTVVPRPPEAGRSDNHLRYNAGNPSSVTFTVRDDDLAKPTVTISTDQQAVTEGNSIIYRVTAEFVPPQDLSVQLRLSGPVAHFLDQLSLPLATSLPITTATTRNVAAIRTLADNEEEQDGELVIAIQPGLGYVVAEPASITIAIHDDDDPPVAAPTVSVTALSAAETPAGGTATFRIDLSAAYTAAVVVDYTTSDGTATAGADYLARGGRQAFVPGELTRSVTITLVSDTRYEEDETFWLRLQRPYNATLGTDAAEITIVDDDAPQLVINAVRKAITEGEDAVFIIAIERGDTPRQDLYANVEIQNQQGEFLLGPSPLTVTAHLSPGTTTATLTVATRDDFQHEEDGAIRAVILPATRGVGLVYTSDSFAEVVTVADNDMPALFIIPADGNTVWPEGALVRFLINTNRAPHSDLTLELAVSETGGYITRPLTTAVVLAAGEVSVNYTVPTTNDPLDRPDGTIRVTLPPPGAEDDYLLNAGLASTLVTITDDEGAATLAVAAVQAPEGQELVFTISLLPPAGTLVTATYATSDGAVAGPLTGPLTGPMTGNYRALAGVDYTTVTGTLSFAPGTTVRRVTVQVQQDGLVEADEDLTLRLSAVSSTVVLAPRGLAGSEATATGTILNDDYYQLTLQPAATMGQFRGTPGLTEGEAAVFVLQASPLPTQPLTVGLVVDFGIPGSDRVNFLAAERPSRITLATGASSTRVTFNTNADDRHSANQQLTVGLAAPPAAAPWQRGNPTAVTLVIWDDDPELQVNIFGSDPPAGPITEGEAVILALQLNSASWLGLPPGDNPELVVPVAFTQQGEFIDPTALTGQYGRRAHELQQFTLSTLPTAITLHYSSATAIQVGTADDRQDEAAGRLGARVTVPAGYTPRWRKATTQTITADQLYLEVLDNDQPALSIRPAGGRTVWPEGATVGFEVSATLAPWRALTLQLGLRETGGYLSPNPPTRVTLAAAGTSVTYWLQTQADPFDRPDGTITVTLPAATTGGGYALTSGATSARVTVTDQQGDATLMVSGDRAPEDRNLVFTLTLEPASGSHITVQYTTSDGAPGASTPAATAGLDYAQRSGQLVFPPGTSVMQLTVVVINDNLAETDEALSLHLTNATASGMLLKLMQPTATGTIEDNDVRTLSIEPGSSVVRFRGRPGVSEGGSAVFVVRTPVAPAGSLTVAVYVTPDAFSGGSFLPASLPTRVTLGRGALSARFTLNTLGDDSYTVNQLVHVGLNNPDSTTSHYRLGSATRLTLEIWDDDPELTLTIVGEGPQLPPAAGPVPEGSTVVVGLYLHSRSWLGVPAMDNPRLVVPVAFSQTGDYIDETGLAGQYGRQEPELLNFSLSTLPTELTLWFERDSAVSVGIGTVDDQVDEANGRVTMTVTVPTGYTPVAQKGHMQPTTVDGLWLAVHDNEVPELALRPAGGRTRWPEGAAVGFQLSSSLAPHRALTIPLRWSETGGYVSTANPPATTVVLAAGQQQLAYTVQTVDDIADRPDGTVRVTLQPPAAAAGYQLDTGQASALVTITDNEAMPVLSVAATSAREDAQMLFTISLQPPSGSHVTVSFATSDGGGSNPAATMGADYLAVSGTAVLLPGATTHQVTVMLINDGLIEGNEDLSLHLSNPGAAARLGSAATAIGTIIENDLHQLSLAVGPTIGQYAGLPGITEGEACGVRHPG